MKQALITSYTAQIYAAAIGVVTMPLYLRYLGPEAFGLVGLFFMLQTWLMLFDLGLTPTLSRQMACYKGGTLSELALRKLLRTLEWLFGFMAFAMMAAGALASSWLARNWLKIEHLEYGEAAYCIAAMAAAAGLRWISGLYRSGLIGLECQTQTNGATAIIATMRFVGILPLLMMVSTKPAVFFSYQVIVAIFESIVFRGLLYRRLGTTAVEVKPSWQALREVLPFAGSVAFTASIWVIVVSLDKLLLSHFLTLHDYGYFSLANLVSGGILLLISPISQVVQPRMTILYAQGRNQEAVELFREASQFVNGLMAAVSVNVAIFAEPLLFAWTGDREAAAHAAPILFWYALGNGVVGILTLPYLVQHAAGNLRLHVVGNIIFSCLQIPVAAYTAWAFGAIGTGIVWLGSNLLVLSVWIPFVFRRFLKGLFLDWMARDIVYPWMIAAIPALLCRLFVSSPTSRLLILAQLSLVGCLSLLLGWSAGERLRIRLVNSFSPKTF